MMMQTLTGSVTVVTAEPFGGSLSAAASSGDTTLTLYFTADFAELGGTLRIGGDDPDAEVIDYTTSDPDANSIALSAALANDWPVDTVVEVWDPASSGVFADTRALVQQEGDVDNSDVLDCAVAHALIPMLPEGIRSPGEGETVTITSMDGSAWTVTDIVGRTPSFDGGAIKPATITPLQLSFTAGGITATIGDTEPVSPSEGDLWFDGNNGFVMKQWDGTEWVETQFGVGSIADGSIGTGQIDFTASDIGGITTSIAGSAPSSPTVGDLWYDSGNDYRLNRWDGTDWVQVQFGTDAITAGSITAALIAANTITASQIAAGTITANEIAAATITASNIVAGTITANEIAAGAITADLIAANAIVAGAIAAGALDAQTINAGSLTAGSISSGTIGSSQIISSGLADCDIVIDPSGGSMLIYALSGQTVTNVTTAGTGTFNVPSGVTSLKVEVWGAGGGGQGAAAGGFGGCGGGGGGYAREDHYAVTPLASIPYGVGAAGTAGANTGAQGGVGQTTSFNTNGVVAFGGLGGGTFGSGTFVSGGAGSGANTIHFTGGFGHPAGGSSGTLGGGGGSSAGTAHDGVSGGAGSNPSTGGPGGTAVTDGGAGGAGGNGGGTGAVGSAGTAPGGGGGGAGSGTTARAGGAGAAGKLRITAGGTRTLVCSIAGVAGTDMYGNSYPAGIRTNYAPAAVGLTGGYSERWIRTSTITVNSGSAGAPGDVLHFNSMDNLISDSGAAFNNSTGVWTCPRDGQYIHTIAFKNNGSLSVAIARLALTIRKNGSGTAYIQNEHNTLPIGSQIRMVFTFTDYWEAGDTFDMFVTTSTEIASFTMTAESSLFSAVRLG